MMVGTKMELFANHVATTVAVVLVCHQILANVTLAIQNRITESVSHIVLAVASMELV